MTYYAIDAAVQHTNTDGWTHTRHLPTFYLHENVQGILHEAAAVQVAHRMIRDVLTIAPGNDDVHILVTACAI